MLSFIGISIVYRYTEFIGIYKEKEICQPNKEYTRKTDGKV